MSMLAKARLNRLNAIIARLDRIAAPAAPQFRSRRAANQDCPPKPARRTA